MKNILTSFVVGFLFSLGLGISGMTDPQKVIGFLDIFGEWDPSLMFVMVGAILVHAVAYFFIKNREKPLMAETWHLPQKSKVTWQLMAGAAIFGLGWGLAGYCPGPALTSVSTLNVRPLLFVGGMFLGMLGFKLLDRKFGFKGLWIWKS